MMLSSQVSQQRLTKKITYFTDSRENSYNPTEHQRRIQERRQRQWWNSRQPV